MKNILDEQSPLKERGEKINLTSNKKRKSIIYTSIMLIGGVIFTYLTHPKSGDFTIVITQSIGIIVIPFLISIVVETIRYLLHKRKERKANKKIERDPFWFQLIENTFALWILTAIAFILWYILVVI